LPRKVTVDTKSTKLNEFKIQNIIFNWAIRKKQHTIAVPNMYLYAWESDMLSITNSLYTHEYEIKTSLSDFKNDFNKASKHCMLSGTLEDGRPAYFWYVCPCDLIDKSLIPDYAGLIYIETRNKPHVIKKAPRISRYKVTDTEMDKLLRGSMWRYWKMREKLNNYEKEHNTFIENDDKFTENDS